MFKPIPIPKHSPLATQFLVIRALLAREIATRFGKYRLGFFWMLLEPLTGVLVLGLIIAPIAGRAVPEIPYPFFILNGLLLLKLFTGTMTSGVRGITANQGLLVYPSVKPMDPLFARFIYELITTLFAFTLFTIVAMWMGLSISLDSLQVILIAYFLTWLCGCGFGMILGIAAAHYSEIEKIVPIINRPLLFVSAVIYPTNALPDSTRAILMWNPLVHTIELSRNALFPFYKTPDANLIYPAVFAIIVLSIGMAYFHNNRNLLSQL